VLTIPETERQKIVLERARSVAQTALGHTYEELDTEWREWVGKKLPEVSPSALRRAASHSAGGG
jgi:hypothetical protein